MARIVVFGGHGTVGGLLVAFLQAAGHQVLGAALAGSRTPGSALGVPPERIVDGQDPQALAGLVGQGDLVVWAAGPRGLSAVTEAAIATRRSVVDVEPDQAHVRWVARQLAPRAAAAGVVVAPGVGFQHFVGDLLVAVAAEELATPRDVHVAYALPDHRWPLRAATPGRRASLAAGLGRTGRAVRHGREVPEHPGEQRRLAWFPRPVGPVHAAAFATGEVVTVPLHVPTVQTVRTYIALSSWRAELLQAVGNLAGRPRGRRWLEGRLLARARPLPASRRATCRWACVAEVADGAQVARAWAYGHDPYRVTAAAATLVVERVLAGAVAPGFLAPAGAGPARTLLDDLGVRTDARWSLRGPGPAR